MPSGNPGQRRKSLHLVLELYSYADDVAQAQLALDQAIRAAIAKDVPWRAISEATGISVGTLRRRFPPSRPRGRWPVPAAQVA